MKILLVYYSRTGTTKKVAEYLAEKLGADLEEFVDLKKREGARGYIIAGRDALMRKLTEIEPMRHAPAEYDLVVIGSPVWVGTLASAPRTFLEQHKAELKKVAAFSVQGSSSESPIFEEAQRVLGKELIASFFVTTAAVVNNEFQNKTEEFSNRIIKIFDQVAG